MEWSLVQLYMASRFSIIGFSIIGQNRESVSG
jgi:hypothetical protein